MRYFFFSYYSYDNGVEASGRYCMTSRRFPAAAEVERQICARTGVNRVLITGWQEFASQEDYDAFLEG